MNDDFLDLVYEGATLRQYLDRSNEQAKWVRKLREFVEFPDEVPELTGNISIELKGYNTSTDEFTIDVIAHGVTDEFNSFAFDADFPGDVQLTGANFDGLPDRWFSYVKMEEGHPKNGLCGGYSGSPYKPEDGNVTLATLSFRGPLEAREHVVLTRVRMSFWTYHLNVLEKKRITPGA